MVVRERAHRMCVSIDLIRLAEILTNEKRFVTLDYVAKKLVTTTRSAGKILRRLEALGLARRHTNRAYEIIIDSAD